MAVAIDKCPAGVRVRDARRDDVKATTIKENEKEKEKENTKENICLLYMEIFASQNLI